MAKYEIKDGVGIIPQGTTKIEGGFTPMAGWFSAFKDSKSLTSVVIPDSVTKIGDYAFWGCSNLTSIIIPNSVTEIGVEAFGYCTNLKSIVIPNSVTMIQKRAFIKCKSLTIVNIPDGVPAIGEDLFYECDNLKTINIPSSVTMIGEHAFHGCTNLTSINIPDSVTAIGDCVFLECTGLKDIVIPKSVKKIGESVFERCTALQTATIFAPAILKKGLFRDCNALETVTFGVGVKKINESAFICCDSLKTICVPTNKGEYYCQLLPQKLQSLIKETGPADSTKPSVKKTSAKLAAAKEPTHPKKVYKVTFKCDCFLAICARFADNAMPFNEVGFPMYFEQGEEILPETKKEALFTCCLYDMEVIDEAGNFLVTSDDYQDLESVDESWVEKKLGLESGNRYYIQSMQTRDEGKNYTFTKKITFKIETEQDFDVNKLKTIYDTKFDELYWNIKRGDSSGIVVDDIEPDEGLTNPYELYYDGKKVKANKISITTPLRGDAYMCFDWPKENK